MIFQIFNAQLKDSEWISRFEKLCFTSPWSQESVMAGIQNPHWVFLAAFAENAPAGYVSAQISFETAYINNLAVAEDFRQMGAGKHLLFELSNQCKLRQAEVLTLEVRPSNAPAIKLYESCGYIAIGRRKNFYSDPQEDALLLEKRI